MMLDPRLSGYLQRALDHEMAALQLYLSQATLCEMWGLGDVAAQMRKEATEELEHAERLTRFMLARGMAPRGTRLPPVRLGRSLEDMLHIDHEVEAEAIRLYDEAARYARRARDMQAFELFAGLLREEEEHLASIVQWLRQLQEGR